MSIWNTRKYKIRNIRIIIFQCGFSGLKFKIKFNKKVLKNQYLFYFWFYLGTGINFLMLSYWKCNLKKKFLFYFKVPTCYDVILPFFNLTESFIFPAQYREINPKSNLKKKPRCHYTISNSVLILRNERAHYILIITLSTVQKRLKMYVCVCVFIHLWFSGLSKPFCRRIFFVRIR